MATNTQVQTFVDERVRPHSELVRKLVILMDDDRASIDDVYAELSGSPTWTDSRTDGPPHLLAPSDVLAFNAFIEDVRTYMKGHASYPVVIKACVRPPEVL